MAPGREWVPGFNEKCAKCTVFPFSIPIFHPKRKTPKAQGWHPWVKVILRMQRAERVQSAAGSHWGGREAAHRPAAWDIERMTPQPKPPTCTSPRSGPQTHGAPSQAPGRSWRRAFHGAVRLLADAGEAREPAVSVLLLFPPHTWSLRGSDGGVSVTTPGGNDSPGSRATRALFSPQAWTAAPCWDDSKVQISSLKLLVVRDAGTESGLSLEPTTWRNPCLRRRAWASTPEPSVHEA